MRKVETQADHHTKIAAYDVDLRELVMTVFRQWKLIAGFTVLVVGAVVIVNVFFIPPVYESSAVVQFRGAAALGFDFRAFQVLSASPSVMDEVGRLVGLDWSTTQVGGRFNFDPEANVQMLTVTATADDPQLAVQLVHAWIEAIRSEILRTLESRFSKHKRVAEENYIAALEELTRAEEALERFDREHSISLLENRFDRIVTELVADEQLLENLKSDTIPTSEARLRALKQALSGETRTLEPGFTAVQSVPTDSAQLPLLNPTYVDLRQQIISLETTIAADRQRVELLEKELVWLRSQADQVREQLVGARFARERLVRNLEEARSTFDIAMREWNEILALERQLSLNARVDVISEPVLPNAPISPRKMHNAAISAMLSLVIGIFGALVLEWWQSPVEQERAKAGATATK